MKRVNINYYSSNGKEINKPEGLVLETTDIVYEIDGPQELEKIYQTIPEKERGPFGDIWQVSKGLATLLHKTYPKAAEAADLGLVIRSKDDHYYFIGIKRKNNPGKGKPAFLGGFCSKPKYSYIESGIYTALKEGEEEIGLEIEGEKKAIDELINNYSIKSYPVQLKFGGKSHKTNIEKVKTIKTTDLPINRGGERLPNGEIRVDKTTLYAILLDTEIESKEFDKTFKETFKAGDDAKSVEYWDITQNIRENKPLEFGIKHHERLFLLLLEYIRNNR